MNVVSLEWGQSLHGYALKACNALMWAEGPREGMRLTFKHTHAHINLDRLLRSIIKNPSYKAYWCMLCMYMNYIWIYVWITFLVRSLLSIVGIMMPKTVVLSLKIISVDLVVPLMIIRLDQCFSFFVSCNRSIICMQL